MMNVEDESQFSIPGRRANLIIEYMNKQHIWIIYANHNAIILSNKIEIRSNKNKNKNKNRNKNKNKNKTKTKKKHILNGNYIMNNM